MQFLTIVVVPDETSDVVAAVTGLMEPYNVERPVAARKTYVPRRTSIIWSRCTRRTDSNATTWMLSSRNSKRIRALPVAMTRADTGG